MSASKPTIVLVHGAFHDSKSFEPLAQRISDAGYNCKYALDMPGSGSTASVAEDAQVIRSAVLEILEGGNDCVVVGHSYGGIAGNQAVEGLAKKQGDSSPGVVKMVYIDANLPKLGESHLQQFQAWQEADGIDAGEILDIKDGLVHFIGCENCFYNDLPEDVRKELYGKLKPQSLHSFTDPLTYVSYNDIPSWYLSGTKDVIMPPSFHKYILNDIGGTVEVVEEIDAGHCSFIGQPAQVADFIIRAAQSVA
ncbi:hypothetical protein Plec18170_001219 [Paecilomyces lecythidis]